MRCRWNLENLLVRICLNIEENQNRGCRSGLSQNYLNLLERNYSSKWNLKLNSNPTTSVSITKTNILLLFRENLLFILCIVQTHAHDVSKMQPF